MLYLKMSFSHYKVKGNHWVSFCHGLLRVMWSWSTSQTDRELIQTCLFVLSFRKMYHFYNICLKQSHYSYRHCAMWPHTHILSDAQWEYRIKKSRNIIGKLKQSDLLIMWQQLNAQNHTTFTPNIRMYNDLHHDTDVASQASQDTSLEQKITSGLAKNSNLENHIPNCPVSLFSIKLNVISSCGLR